MDRGGGRRSGEEWEEGEETGVRTERGGVEE